MNLEGKTAVFLGDSITEGVGVEECIEKRYDNIIKEKCGLKEVHNYGIGGTRLAHQIKVSDKPRFDLCFCGRAYDLNSDADLIVVYGGVNDYLHGDAPFGEMTDKLPSTFCGGVEFLMNLINELYPKAQKVFMTPARCEGYTKPSDNPVKNNNALPLVNYVEVIEKKGKEHNIPVLNLYEKLPINPDIAEDKEKYTVDGLHFNAVGQGVLAETLMNFIKEL